MLTEIRQSTEQQQKKRVRITLSFPFFFYPNNSVRLSSTAIRTYFISSLSLIVVFKKKKDPICGVTEAVETEHVSAYFTSFPQKKKKRLFFSLSSKHIISFFRCVIACFFFFLVCFSFTLFFFFFFYIGFLIFVTVVKAIMLGQTGGKKKLVRFAQSKRKTKNWACSAQGSA